MSIDNLCTHPDTWECKPSANDPSRCVGQAKYEAWIVAEGQMAKADKVYINVEENPNVVGNLDLTDNERKLPLGPTGNSEQIPLPADFNDVPDVDHDALAYWRQCKER